MLKGHTGKHLKLKQDCYRELLGKDLNLVKDENGWIPRDKTLTNGTRYQSSGDFHSFIEFQQNIVSKAKLKKSLKESVRFKDGRWEVYIWAVFENVEGIVEYKVTGEVCGANNKFVVLNHYK